MKPAIPFLKFCAVIMALVVVAPVVHAAEVSQPVLLVASDKLERSPFAQTVLLAVPLPSGGHIGFIVNRPTTVKLETLFPDDEPSRAVDEPVYLGGPKLGQALFALARGSAPEGDGVLQIIPGLFAALNATSVDHIIATTPNEARYFVGLVLWDVGELEEQMQNGVWNALPADADTVLDKKPDGLWTSLRARTPKAA